IRSAAALASLLALSSAVMGAADAADAAADSMAAIIADFERFQRQVDPVTAGQEGDREALRRLPDVRLEAQQAQQRELERFDKRLSAISVKNLPAEDALDHALLTHIVRQETEAIGFDFVRIAF